jgi:predicted GIY-YIG superfamily endonuclease
MKRKTARLPKRRKIQRRGQFFVYILECSDGSFYTGYTNHLQKRVLLHNKGGGSKYVKTRLPAKLVFSKSYKYYKLAILEERRIKTLARKEKESLVYSSG